MQICCSVSLLKGFFFFTVFSFMLLLCILNKPLFKLSVKWSLVTLTWSYFHLYLLCPLPDTSDFIVLSILVPRFCLSSSDIVPDVQNAYLHSRYFCYSSCRRFLGNVLMKVQHYYSPDFRFYLRICLNFIIWRLYSTFCANA